MIHESGSAPVTSATALASHLRAAVRPAYLRLTRTAPNRHERAFLDYQLALPAILHDAPQPFTVTASVEIAASPGRSIRELTLTTPTQMAEVGDMLSLLWQNTPEAIAVARPERERPVGYWTTPAPGIPSTRAHATPHRILTEVLDLGEPAAGPTFDALLRHARRLTPRIYTLSGVRALLGGGQELRILVSHHSSWPARAAAHLHRARPGDVLHGRVLPHPHRLPALHGWSDDGIAAVTGSGIAGVLAALRGGVGGTPWVVWGLRGSVAPGVRDELDSFVADGSISRLDVVDSLAVAGPRHVTDVLAESANTLTAAVAAGHWLYVSGNASAGDQIRAAIATANGPEAVARLQDELRFVQST